MSDKTFRIGETELTVSYYDHLIGLRDQERFVDSYERITLTCQDASGRKYTVAVEGDGVKPALIRELLRVAGGDIVRTT